MRFSVRHETIYRYSAPVRLGSHILRFSPRGDGATLIEHRLIVDPTPVAIVEERDVFGNLLTHLEFEGDTDHLSIESVFALDTVAPPTWGDEATEPLPWPADPHDPSAVYRDPEGGEPTVRAFAEAIAEAAGGRARSFLERLNRTLFERTGHHIRDGGAAQPPEVTLATGRGACRDTAVLFIAAARSLGLRARFVSGYQARAETADGRRHLHAWPEVYVPGAGWRGYDPTHGIVVEDGHVALCAAPDQSGTMPVQGGFWGTGVGSTLAYAIEIETDG